MKCSVSFTRKQQFVLAFNITKMFRSVRNTAMHTTHDYSRTIHTMTNDYHTTCMQELSFIFTCLTKKKKIFMDSEINNLKHKTRRFD